MALWEIHGKWAQKLRISKEISNYMNRAVDNINVPEDFRKHTEKEKIPIVKMGNTSIADIISLFGKKNLHDRGKDKFIKSEDLKFLSTTRKRLCKSMVFTFYFRLFKFTSIKRLDGKYG